MIDSINNIYDEMYKELKKYLSNNSKYKPYTVKKEPNEKKFPIVIFKELYDNSTYTTLKYTDEIYYLDFEINIYAIQNNSIASMTIADEITYLIVKFFKDNYKVNVKVSKDVVNIDTTVYRNLINISFKVETKYKDKLVISPK